MVFDYFKKIGQTTSRLFPSLDVTAPLFFFIFNVLTIEYLFILNRPNIYRFIPSGRLNNILTRPLS